VGAGLTSRDGRPPLIGITTSELRRHDQNPPIEESEPPGPELALGLSYPIATVQAGGLPMVLPPLPSVGVDAVLERVDALLFSGGPDLHPAAYGRPAHPELGPTEPELDVHELLLCRAALARGTPVLGVCRGMQLLNVASGGTLHQHLPDVVGVTVEHRSPLRGVKASHVVEVVTDTRMEEIVGRSELTVNSFHHQAIDDLGEGLRVNARAPDGVIEGVEGTDEAFVLGVQWHVESLAPEQSRHGALVAALVDAGRRAGEMHRVGA